MAAAAADVGSSPAPRTSQVLPAGSLETLPRRLPGGLVFLPKPIQRLLGIRTELATETEIRTGRELMGRVVPDQNAIGRVQAISDGQITAPENGLPHIGQKIARDEILGYLNATLSVTEEAQLRQSLAQIDRDMALLLPRSEHLGIVNPNMPMGEAAVALLQEMQIQAQGLTKQREIVTAALKQKVEIKAPIAGYVSVARVTAGQVVATRDTLFEIVDPSRAWVEAWSYDTIDDGPIKGATATTDDGRRLKLEFLGRGRSLQQQSIPLLFRIADNPTAVDIGRPVRVFMPGPNTVRGIVVPRTAITPGTGGLAIVWEHTDPETFRPRRVMATPLNSARATITGEVSGAMRLVVEGALLISEIR